MWAFFGWGHYFGCHRSQRILGTPVLTRTWSFHLDSYGEENPPGPGARGARMPPSTSKPSMLWDALRKQTLLNFTYSVGDIQQPGVLLKSTAHVPAFSVNYPHFLFSIFNLSLLCPRIWLSLVCPKKVSSTAFPGHYSSS